MWIRTKSWRSVEASGINLNPGQDQRPRDQGEHNRRSARPRYSIVRSWWRRRSRLGRAVVGNTECVPTSGMVDHEAQQQHLDKGLFLDHVIEFQAQAVPIPVQTGEAQSLWIEEQPFPQADLAAQSAAGMVAILKHRAEEPSHEVIVGIVHGEPGQQGPATANRAQERLVFLLAHLQDTPGAAIPTRSLTRLSSSRQSRPQPPLPRPGSNAARKFRSAAPTDGAVLQHATLRVPAPPRTSPVGSGQNAGTWAAEQRSWATGGYCGRLTAGNPFLHARLLYRDCLIVSASRCRQYPARRR